MNIFSKIRKISFKLYFGHTYVKFVFFLAKLAVRYTIILFPFYIKYRCKKKLLQNKYRFSISMHNLLTLFSSLFFYWLKYD